MAEPAIRITGSEVKKIDGVLALVFQGQDSEGRNIELAIPAAGFDQIAEDCRTKIEAAINAEFESRSGQWSQSIHRSGIPAKVGTTDEGTVLLVARFGSPTETRLSFSRSDALALAAELRATADTIPLAVPLAH